MTAIIADRWLIPLPVDALRVCSPGGNGDQLERLTAMKDARLAGALAFLIGYAPGIFDAIVTATEPCADDEPDPSLEPEPFCTACGGNAGIFWPLGEDWRHYRTGAGPGGKPTVYDPGHTPVIGWRSGGNGVPVLAVIPVPAIQLRRSGAAPAAGGKG